MAVVAPLCRAAVAACGYACRASQERSLSPPACAQLYIRSPADVWYPCDSRDAAPSCVALRGARDVVCRGQQ